MGKMSAVKKPSATMGITKVLLDNTVRDLIRKWSLGWIELVQFSESSRDQVCGRRESRRRRCRMGVFGQSS